MIDQGTSGALARRVRTFADDMRRAKKRSDAPSETRAEHAFVSAPAAQTAHTAVSSVIHNPVSHAPNPSRAKPSPQSSEISHLAYEEKPLDIRREAGSSQQEGIIIKDTRRKRWALGKALGNSFTAWVAEQKNTVTQIADAKNSEPNVPPPDTRIKVIQAAREKSAIAPKDDRRAVVEKLRTFARDAERVTGKSYTIISKPAQEKTTPRWSYTDENAADGEPGAGKRPSLIKQARQTIRPPQPPPIRTSAPSLQPVKSLQKDVAPTAGQALPERAFVQAQEKVAPLRSARNAPTPYGIADVAPTVARELAKETLREAQRETPIAPETVSRDIVFEQPVFAVPETQKLRTYRDDAIHDVEQHQRSVPNIAAAEAARRAAHTPPLARQRPHETSARPFVIAGIAMICIIAIGGFGFFWYARQHPKKTATVSIPTFIAIDAQTSVPFSNNRAALLETLDVQARASGSGVMQIYPTYTEGPAENQSGKTGGAAVTTSDFMYVLDPRAPGSFIRNLDEEMMFGAHSGAGGTDLFFILKTKQFDTAFAGMLDWEPYISADLTPLFGAPVTRSQDLALRTADQTRAAYFVDDTIRNTDVRILYDETGTERILYAFLNKNTIVITTSSAALIELIERLQ